MKNPPPLLELDNLRVEFPSALGTVSVVDGVNLCIRRGQHFCLLGESGCGKSMVAMSILGLLPKNAMVSGKVVFEGQDLFRLGDSGLRQVRGKSISMVFETPGIRLNPLMTVGSQIAEAARRRGLTTRQAKSAAVELLARTGIPSPAKRARQYPFQYSGGMAQRAMIAMALAARPRLLIADEPTTALDPTVQMQIIELMLSVVEEIAASLFLITHDFDVASELCDSAGVLYDGQMMEVGGLRDIMDTPRHPYARALVKTFDRGGIHPIQGNPPPLTNPPPGCRFHPRCPLATSACSKDKPRMKDGTRCFYSDKVVTN